MGALLCVEKKGALSRIRKLLRVGHSASIWGNLRYFVQRFGLWTMLGTRIDMESLFSNTFLNSGIDQELISLTLLNTCIIPYHVSIY